ncbi:hypothetical protein N9850_01585 [Granulosicoccus sp.]|nr:hypothetical protein [Granulosicoccus sp.]MDB4222433.1 hypothetical protein [Granulosicoccus sp.]
MVILSTLFECMGMTIPVLHCAEGDLVEILEQEGGGLLFELENSDALVEGLDKFAVDSAFHLRVNENGPSQQINTITQF